MANNEYLGGSFGLDVKPLKMALKDANAAVKASESEFRKAAAGMDDWTQSSDGLEKRVGSLADQLETQKSKMALIIKAKDDLIAKNEAAGRSEEAIADQLAYFDREIEKAGRDVDRTAAQLSKAEKNLDAFGKETNDASEEARDFSGALDVVAGAAAAVGTAIVGAVTGFFALAEETRELRTQMGKLETAFETAGHSAEDAEATFSTLYGVLGDQDKATEAGAFLAQMASDEEELADLTTILTGTYATFGDALPTEGLAEAILHSRELGSVQGNLADALEWAGVNVDDFNSQLAECSTEQERQALINETLLDLYGESAEAYRENNAEIIAANEAQNALNQSMAELGAIAEPVMTTLKTIAADLLGQIMPFVTLIGEGLTGALTGADGAAEKLAEGIGGVVETALQIVGDMLPVVIDLIVALIPQLLESLLNALPTLAGFLLNDVLPQVLDMLAQLIPQILAQIVEIVPQLVVALTGAVPTILNAAITLLMAIVQALPQILAELLGPNGLPLIISSILTAVIEAVPLLLDGALQLFNALVDAIPLIVDLLMQSLPQIIETILQAVITATPLLLDAALQLLGALLRAIPTIAQQLFAEVPRLTATILRQIAAAAPQLFQTAKDLFFRLVDAVPTIGADLLGAVGSILTSVKEGITAEFGAITEIGADLIRGLWNGISSMADWVADKISGFGEGILEDLQDFFGIASPSRVMRDQVGQYLAQGVGVGFEDEMASVGRDMQAALEDAIPAGEAAVNIAATTTGGAAEQPAGPTTGGGQNITINQTNNYSARLSRDQIRESARATAAAVRQHLPTPAPA